jgi:hypothetical protein
MILQKKKRRKKKEGIYFKKAEKTILSQYHVRKIMVS